MTFQLRAFVSFAVIVVLTAMIVRVRAEPPARLTVRLYNSAGVSAPELLAARDTALSILGDGGLDVRVRHCGRAALPGIPADACPESLKAAEMVVRIIDAPVFNTALNPEAFGVTYVVQDTNRGWLATVFSDRIDQAAARGVVGTRCSGV